jgi:hypothetical protein
MSTIRNPQPWERQPRETDKAWEAFTTYRDMGDGRTKQAVSDRLSKSRQLIQRWAALWDWDERVRAYVVADDKAWLDSLAHERRKAAQRWVRLAQAAQAKTGQALTNLQPADLTPGDLTRLLKLAVDVEKDALGMATQIDITSGGETIQLTGESAVAAALAALSALETADAVTSEKAETPTGG